jgi:hypothetical protein
MGENLKTSLGSSCSWHSFSSSSERTGLGWSADTTGALATSPARSGPHTDHLGSTIPLRLTIALRLPRTAWVVTNRRDGGTMRYRLAGSHVRLLLDVAREHLGQRAAAAEESTSRALLPRSNWRGEPVGEKGGRQREGCERNQ